MIKSIFITLAVMLALFGCRDSPGSSSVPDFTGNVADFTAWLDEQPANTAASPYIIELNIDNEADFTTLRTTLKSDENENKYVYLDLSGSTVTTIPDEAFCSGTQPALWIGCATLTGIIIPNRVTSIGDYAFYKCESLTSVTIPNSVTSIGQEAFWACTSLTSITIPDSVTSIGDHAFYVCSSLTSVIIPNSVTSIGMSAFNSCSSLASVSIPNSVTSIRSGAFVYCSSLTSVTIPASVTSIGEASFNSCTSLTSVTFQGTVPSSGFYDGTEWPAFDGDLRSKFYATNATNGTPGTYTRASGGSTWTKK